MWYVNDLIGYAILDFALPISVRNVEYVVLYCLYLVLKLEISNPRKLHIGWEFGIAERGKPEPHRIKQEPRSFFWKFSCVPCVPFSSSV
jgi:hypothetical protein